MQCNKLFEYPPAMMFFTTTRRLLGRKTSGAIFASRAGCKFIFV